MKEKGEILYLGSDNTMEEVRAGWQSIFQEGKTAVLDNSALARMVGVAVGTLAELREKRTHVKIMGHSQNEWLIRLAEPGRDKSDKAEYEHLYDEVSRRLNLNLIRMDEFSEEQDPVWFLYNELPGNIQEEVEAAGRHPTLLKNSDPALG